MDKVRGRFLWATFWSTLAALPRIFVQMWDWRNRLKDLDASFGVNQQGAMGRIIMLLFEKISAIPAWLFYILPAGFLLIWAILPILTEGYQPWEPILRTRLQRNRGGGQRVFAQGIVTNPPMATTAPLKANSSKAAMQDVYYAMADEQRRSSEDQAKTAKPETERILKHSMKGTASMDSLNFASTVQDFLESRKPLQPKLTLAQAQLIGFAHSVMTPYDRQTLERYNKDYLPTAREIFQRVRNSGRNVDAGMDRLLFNGPKNIDEIVQISKVLLYLDGHQQD